MGKSATGLLAEKQFGPYRLVHRIATGGMAEIFLARAEGVAGFEKYVALKMIHPNFSEDDDFVTMLIDEAKITVQLQHVNIVQTFDLGKVNDTYYITMEYVDGVDLYKLLQAGATAERPVPIAVASFIAKEISAGLDYAHRRRDIVGNPLGIVHRDVSPQNILVSRSGEIKLVDFGIAKATMRAMQTEAGVIKGKYYYMSPEQASGQIVDRRTDIFSTGIILYELLTGQMLYLEEDVHKLLDKVRAANIEAVTNIRPDTPTALAKIVHKALAKNPDNRYASSADLARDLDRFLNDYAPVFTSSQVSAWSDSVLSSDGGDAWDEGTTRAASKVLRPDDLVRNPSEFTDDNSLIRDAFVAGASRAPASVPPGVAPMERSNDDETRNLSPGHFGGSSVPNLHEEQTLISDPPSFGGSRAGVDPAAATFYEGAPRGMGAGARPPQTHPTRPAAPPMQQPAAERPEDEPAQTTPFPNLRSRGAAAQARLPTHTTGRPDAALDKRWLIAVAAVFGLAILIGVIAMFTSDEKTAPDEAGEIQPSE